MPTALADLPEMDVFTNYYYEVYTRLRRSWQPAMGAEPLPLSEITSYCAFLDDDDPEMFIEVMLGADSVYLERAREKKAK